MEIIQFKNIIPTFFVIHLKEIDATRTLQSFGSWTSAAAHDNDLKFIITLP